MDLIHSIYTKATIMDLLTQIHLKGFHLNSFLFKKQFVFIVQRFI